VCAGRRNARRGFRSVAHRIAILMQVGTRWIYFDLWPQLATMPECSSEIGDRQHEKHQCNCYGRVICNGTRGINARCAVSRHRNESDGSDELYPLWRSGSAQIGFFFADGITVGSNLPYLVWAENLPSFPFARTKLSPLPMPRLVYIIALLRWFNVSYIIGTEYRFLIILPLISQ